MNKIQVSANGAMRRRGNAKVFSKKPLTVPICPPQIPHGPTWDTKQVAVKGWQPQPRHDQINFDSNNTQRHYVSLDMLNYLPSSITSQKTTALK
jgi:hypothetical protein